MADPELVETMSDRERAYFSEACLEWPQNADGPETQTFDDSCCWKWADGNDRP